MVNIYGLPKEITENNHIRILSNTVRSETALHMHNYYEIEIVLSGRCKQNLNGEIYNITEGSVYFLSPVDFHKLYDVEETVKVTNIAFENYFGSSVVLQDLTNRSHNIITQLNDTEKSLIEKIISLLVVSTATNDKYSEKDIRNILESLLIYLLRKVNESNESLPSIENSPIQNGVKYIFAHYRENPSLSDVARISGYNESYFGKKFKELTGKTYIEFLNSLKVNYAKILLLTGKSTVIEIASDCGFSSMSNFNRVFKLAVGMSPSEFAVKNKRKK